MHLEVALVAVENVLILACESQVALLANQCGNVILIDAILFGHDIEANSDALPYHVDLWTALRALVHLPGRLLGLFQLAGLVVFLLGQALRRLLGDVVPLGLVSSSCIKLVFHFLGCIRSGIGCKSLAGGAHVERGELRNWLCVVEHHFEGQGLHVLLRLLGQVGLLLVLGHLLLWRLEMATETTAHRCLVVVRADRVPVHALHVVHVLGLVMMRLLLLHMLLLRFLLRRAICLEPRLVLQHLRCFFTEAQRRRSSVLLLRHLVEIIKGVILEGRALVAIMLRMVLSPVMVLPSVVLLPSIMVLVMPVVTLLIEPSTLSSVVVFIHNLNMLLINKKL